MIFKRSFSPFSKASAKWSACSAVILPGNGGSCGSTTASMTAGPGSASACRKVLSACFGSSMVKPAAPPFRANGKIDGLEFHAKLGIRFLYHLLPLDLTQNVVFDHDNFDRQLIFDEGRDLTHKHCETAVTHYAHHLAPWIGHGCASPVRQTLCGRGEKARKPELHPVAHLYISVCPGRN